MAWVQLLHLLVFRDAMQSQPNSTSNSDSDLFPSESIATSIQLSFPSLKIQVPGRNFVTPSSLEASVRLPSICFKSSRANQNLNPAGIVFEQRKFIQRSAYDMAACTGTRLGNARPFRVTRAALGNPARGDSTHTAAASARTPSESEIGDYPASASEPPPTLARSTEYARASSDRAPDPQLASSCAGMERRRTRTASAASARLATHRPARIRHSMRTARTGGGGVRESENGNAGFPRSEPAAARMCTHSGSAAKKRVRRGWDWDWSMGARGADRKERRAPGHVA
ncbi:hypothetical protein C8F04DRAFT_1189318 [Mycena alexandri]|uniref:Uncharacterized protein n=1 Tax=Mycena alexandri TaxID=1745969 RepID=A0AAD6SGL7_9AGAR|nr:hypothetical protein C8F04DRAFT_1189318 [Mycena alexandri]